LQALTLGDGSFRLRFRDSRLSHLQRDAREEKVCEHSFSGEQRLIEKYDRGHTQPPRLKVPPFMEEQ